MVGPAAQLPSVLWEDASIICAPFCLTGAHILNPVLHLCSALNEHQRVGIPIEADGQLQLLCATHTADGGTCAGVRSGSAADAVSIACSHTVGMKLVLSGS